MSVKEIVGSNGACTDVSYTEGDNGDQNVAPSMDKEQVILHAEGIETLFVGGRIPAEFLNEKETKEGELNMKTITLDEICKICIDKANEEDSSFLDDNMIVAHFKKDDVRFMLDYAESHDIMQDDGMPSQGCFNEELIEFNKYYKEENDNKPDEDGIIYRVKYGGGICSMETIDTVNPDFSSVLTYIPDNTEGKLLRFGYLSSTHQIKIGPNAKYAFEDIILKMRKIMYRDDLWDWACADKSA